MIRRVIGKVVIGLISSSYGISPGFLLNGIVRAIVSTTGILTSLKKIARLSVQNGIILGDIDYCI